MMPNFLATNPDGGAGQADKPGSAGRFVIERTSLSKQVLPYLREMITTGRFEPGERISERIVCEELKISRTPLREALKILAEEGMVTIIPHSGAVVAKLTEEEIREVMTVVSGLEQLAARLICPRLSDLEIEHFESLHLQMLSFYETGDRVAYLQLNIGIHELFPETTRNRVLLETYQRLNNRILRTRYLSNADRRQWRQSVDEHEALLRAIKNRDGEEAAAVLQHHYRPYATG